MQHIFSFLFYALLQFRILLPSGTEHEVRHYEKQLLHHIVILAGYLVAGNSEFSVCFRWLYKLDKSARFLQSFKLTNGRRTRVKGNDRNIFLLAFAFYTLYFYSSEHCLSWIYGSWTTFHFHHSLV